MQRMYRARQRDALRRLRRPALALAVVLTAPQPAVAHAVPCEAVPTAVRRGFPMPSGTGETSGLAASSQYPGAGWMIRDSGNWPSLYSVRFRGAQGHLVREFHVAGARNTDWEDIVYARNRDGSGRLYIVESGQSGRDRTIYKVPEPDPDRPGRIVRLHQYRYAYPENRHYNTEAAFFHRSRLVLVTKTAPARVYRFEQRLSPTTINRPRFVGVLRGAHNVSVARVSPDGRTLMAASHRWFHLYTATGDDPDLTDFVDRRPVWQGSLDPGDNVEAGDFFPAGGCDLVLVAENKNVYRILAQSGS